MKNRDSYGLYINGEWVDSISGKTLLSDNPAKPKQILGFSRKETTKT
jgi:hypothetical protein